MIKTYVVDYSEIHLATVHLQLIADFLKLLSNIRVTHELWAIILKSF